jgi:glycosyltransferase involved in cell wall biosynthesis
VKILVKTPLDLTSGYGNDGCGLARALVALGHEVRLFPVNVAPPVPMDVAQMLTIPYDPPFDAVVIHADPMSMLLESSTRKVAMRALGWSMWEWKQYKPSHGPGPKNFRKRLKDFDALVCYDDVTKEALGPWVPEGVRTPVLQGGFWSDDWPEARERDWGQEPFRYLMVGQLHTRKDPFAAIEAFAHLKRVHGDAFKAELHLKTNIGGLHPMLEEAYDGLFIHYSYWSQQRMYQMYQDSHCLLAPSKGEGKNLPALEMMSTGGAVIATNFGGHTQWLSSEYAYPLDFELVDEGSGVAARASREDLARLMWHVYTNRDEARRKGEVAARTVRSMCDWVPVARKLVRIIEDIPPRSVVTGTLLDEQGGDR